MKCTLKCTIVLFPRCTKLTVPAFKISYIFENEEKFVICINKIQFFLSISENKMVLVILPKKLTFRSEYLNFQVLTISSILVPLKNNIKFDFKHI